jgi:Secretion system C-terminal sorting domain
MTNNFSIQISTISYNRFSLNLHRNLKTVIIGFLFLHFVNLASAQFTVKGGCTSISYVSGTPPLTNTTPLVTAFSPSTGCTRVLTNVSTPCLANGINSTRYSLQRLGTNGTWSVVVSTFTCFPITPPIVPGTASNHGTYRVGAENPTAISGGGCTGGSIIVQNLLGQFIGFAGFYSGTPTLLSNQVVVGKTLPSEAIYTFTDLTNLNPNLPVGLTEYDQGEQININTTQSRNYDRYQINIQEYNKSNNTATPLWSTTGWMDGSLTSIYSLSGLWGNGNWPFLDNKYYILQYVLENKECGNTPWNNVGYKIGICPPNSGCRFWQEDQGIILSPNPASTIIRLDNFEADLGRDYQILICDLAGKTIKSETLFSNEIDISDLPNGMFAVAVKCEGKSIFSSKLVVNQ